jgi:hypothetical protein
MLANDPLEEPFEQFFASLNPPWAVEPPLRKSRTFMEELQNLPGVDEVFLSGSFARGTSLFPPNDLDHVAVFDDQAAGSWGTGWGSAERALRHLAAGILELAENWAVDLHVSRAELRSHVVRLDPVASHVTLGGPGTSVPPIEIMPARRVGGKLYVPERRFDRWHFTDPQTLIQMTRQRQQEWHNYGNAVRAVKAWADSEQLDLSSVAVEALALKFMPRGFWFRSMTRGEALAGFFKAAADARIWFLNDPSGVGGRIQNNIDYQRLWESLTRASVLTEAAVRAEREGRPNEAQDLWRETLSAQFPAATGVDPLPVDRSYRETISRLSEGFSGPTDPTTSGATSPEVPLWATTLRAAADADRGGAPALSTMTFG